MTEQDKGARPAATEGLPEEVKILTASPDAVDEPTGREFAFLEKDERTSMGFAELRDAWRQFKSRRSKP